MAAHTELSANALYPSGHESLPPTSMFSNISASDQDEAKASLTLAPVKTPAAETAAGTSPSHIAGATVRIPDWNGIWRDTGIIIGTQFAAAGLTYSLPESFSSWSDEQKKYSSEKYADNFVSPVIDKDKFYINYAIHPYWGATYYTRGRERGLDRGSSFAYSALMSTIFEFGVECIFEKPSIQDLIVTPIAGSLLGAYLFEPWRESIKRKPELLWYDHAALIITDPLGVLSLGFESLFGIQPTIMVDYSTPRINKGSTGSVTESKSNRFDVILQFSLN